MNCDTLYQRQALNAHCCKECLDLQVSESNSVHRVEDMHSFVVNLFAGLQYGLYRVGRCIISRSRSFSKCHVSIYVGLDCEHQTVD